MLVPSLCKHQDMLFACGINGFDLRIHPYLVDITQKIGNRELMMEEYIPNTNILQLPSNPYAAMTYTTVPTVKTLQTGFK